MSKIKAMVIMLVMALGIIGASCCACEETKIQVSQGKDGLTDVEQFNLEESSYTRQGNGTYVTPGFQEYEKNVPYSIFVNGEEFGQFVFGHQPSNKGGEYVYHTKFTPTEKPEEPVVEEPIIEEPEEPEEPVVEEPSPTVEEEPEEPAPTPIIEEEFDPEEKVDITEEVPQLKVVEWTVQARPAETHEIDCHVTPKTGDDSNVVGAICMMLLAIGVIAVAFRRERRD